MFYNIITLTIKLFFTLRRTVIRSYLSLPQLPKSLINQLFQPLHPQNSLPKFTHQKTSIFLDKSTKSRIIHKLQHNTITCTTFVDTLIIKNPCKLRLIATSKHLLPNI